MGLTDMGDGNETQRGPRGRVREVKAKMARIAGVSPLVRKTVLELYKAGTKRFPEIAKAVREKTGQGIRFPGIGKILRKLRKVKPRKARRKARGAGRPRGGRRGPGRPKGSGRTPGFLVVLPDGRGEKILKLVTPAEVKSRINRFAAKGGDPAGVLVYARRRVKVSRSVEVTL